MKIHLSCKLKSWIRYTLLGKEGLGASLRLFAGTDSCSQIEFRDKQLPGFLCLRLRQGRYRP